MPDRQSFRVTGRIEAISDATDIVLMMQTGSYNGGQLDDILRNILPDYANKTAVERLGVSPHAPKQISPISLFGMRVVSEYIMMGGLSDLLKARSSGKDDLGRSSKACLSCKTSALAFDFERQTSALERFKATLDVHCSGRNLFNQLVMRRKTLSQQIYWQVCRLRVSLLGIGDVRQRIWPTTDQR